jgi:hypothetical protein
MAIAPQFRLIDRRRKDTDLFNAVSSSIEDFQKSFYKKIINAVIEFSPVDTGTYMESHQIQDAYTSSVGTASSSGKPRNQNRGPIANEAKTRLYAAIDALPPGNTNLFIGNYAVHAPLVEYGGAKMPVAYAPYTRARSLTPRFIREALEEVSL